MKLNMDDFWKEFDEDPNSFVEKNLEVDLGSHPYVLMGKFYKTMSIGSFADLLKAIAPDPPENDETFKKIEQYKFIKSYQYIKDLDMSNSYHVEQIKKHPIDKIKILLSQSIKFFEDLEQYEKCAVLKKILDVL